MILTYPQLSDERYRTSGPLVYIRGVSTLSKEVCFVNIRRVSTLSKDACFVYFREVTTRSKDVLLLL